MITETEVDLSGRTALVTGATSGIGKATAKALAKRGAQVVLGVRNTRAGEDVAADIRKQVSGAQVTVGPPLDLLSNASIKAFAADVGKR